MRAYVTLHTVANGQHLTHLPTADRILAESDTFAGAADHARSVCSGTRDYALAVARADLWIYEP